MSFARDLTERVLWTFVQSFLGTLSAAPLVDVDLPTVKVAALAGAAAVLSLLKGVAASRLGTPGTASTADHLEVDELGNLDIAP